MRRVLLIVNPYASAVTKQRVTAVEAELGRVASVEKVLTRAAGHAIELAAAACASGGCDAIFVFSGDGGFNEAVNGADGNVPLGFVPGGGTSVLPRALGLPADSAAAARQLAEAFAASRIRRISVGRVNGRRFTFSSGLGFDAEVVRRVDAFGRAHDGRRPGDVRFALTIGRMLIERRARYEPALEIENRGRAAFAIVANTSPYTYIGSLGLPILPEARFELGLDLIAPVEVRARNLPRLVRYALRGAREDDPNVVYAHDVDRIEIRCDRQMPLHVDGEDLGDVDRASFEVERNALAVVA